MKSIFTIFLFFVFVISACKQAPKQQDVPKTSYKLQTISLSSLTTKEAYTASIRGKQDIAIYPQVSGYLKDIKIKEGDVVKEGDILFIIEQAPFKAAYAAAKAAVEVAEAAVATAELTYKNTVNLNKKGIVSDSDLQMKQNALTSAKAGLSSAKANEIAAKTNLNFTIIKSPSNGIIGNLPYRQGTLVSPALPKSLTTVSDNSEMYVYFALNENNILDLVQQYGALDSVVKYYPELELTLNNGNQYKYKGYLESISGIIESTTGAVNLRAVFPNNERQLLSGGAGRIISETTNSNVIVIPKSATFEVQNLKFVYKIIDGKAIATKIDISKKSTDTEFIVTNGLEKGDVIIADGAGLVREGTAINQ